MNLAGSDVYALIRTDRPGSFLVVAARTLFMRWRLIPQDG